MGTLAERVLVVDDNAFVRGVVEEMLVALGYEVETAGDGKEALERIRAQKFALVVTELIMPRKSGFELIKELRHRDHDVKILAITAAPEPVSAWALPYGAHAILRKPVGNAELGKTLAALFGSQTQQSRQLSPG
jgi:CheY-like chemotaxis protein